MVKFDYYSTIVTIQLKQLLFNDNFKQVISSHWIADIPASSDELSVSSSLILSTRSSLPQLLNALADFSYVAFDPSLCFHLFSIASLCASTDRGSNPKISSSSALVRSRKGPCHCVIACEIARRYLFEHGCFHFMHLAEGYTVGSTK